MLDSSHQNMFSSPWEDSRRPRRDASEVTMGKVKGREAAGPAELTGALMQFSLSLKVRSGEVMREGYPNPRANL